MSWSRPAGHRSATITTAAPGRGPAGGPAPDRGGEGVLRARPGRRGVITGAAAAGNTRLGPELAELNTLRAAHGEEAFAAALDRAVAFSRWRAADVRSILAAGAGLPGAASPGGALILQLPAVPVRPLSDYAIGGLS